MDNFLDKFGLYDFFGLLLPGMLFAFWVIFADLPLFVEKTFLESEVLQVVGFVLISYIIGILMQEIDSVLFKHLRKSAILNFINEKKEEKNFKEKIKWFFLSEDGFVREELEDIKHIVNITIGKDIGEIECEERKQYIEKVFHKYKVFLENNGKINKADRLDALFAMSRDILVVNIFVFVISVLVIITDLVTDRYICSDVYVLSIIYVLVSSPIFYRRARRFSQMRVRTVIRQYVDLNSNSNLRENNEK